MPSDNKNAFEQLETRYPKEFKKVYKKLNYQMLYSEAEILLDLLLGTDYREGNVHRNDYIIQSYYKDWLGIK